MMKRSMFVLGGVCYAGYAHVGKWPDNAINAWGG